MLQQASCRVSPSTLTPSGLAHPHSSQPGPYLLCFPGEVLGPDLLNVAAGKGQGYLSCSHDPSGGPALPPATHGEGKRGAGS